MIAGTEPKVELVQVDVEEIYKAIEKNGWGHLRGRWIGWIGKEVTGACVLGQALLNLGVVGSYGIARRFLDVDYDNTEEIQEVMTTINNFSLENQLGKLTNTNPRWYIPEEEGASVVNTIIYWNDVMTEDGAGFVLKTYEEVTQMCYDVLSPHFGTKLTLMKFDYGI